jgi:hypothetical protein
VSRVGTDEAREHRIHMEIIVDCYDEDERLWVGITISKGSSIFPFGPVHR